MNEEQPVVWYVTMAFPVPSEAFASVEIRELRRQGIDVQVKTLRQRRQDHGTVSRQQRTEGVDVCHATWFAFISGLVGWLRNPLVALRLYCKLFQTLWHRPKVLAGCLWWSFRCFELLAQVRKHHPEVVHLYWGHVPAIVGWLILERLPEQRLTTSLSAYDIEMAIPLSFEVARRCNAIRTWSPSSVPVLQRHGVALNNAEVVHQGIDVRVFEELGDQTHGKIPGRLAVAGRLIPEKGVAEVIRILAEVSKHQSAVRLDVYGDGPERANLEWLIDELDVGNRVTLHGHVDQRTLYRALRQAEGFFLHSIHSAERLPNVVKEAIAAGCWVLTTQTPDIERIITCHANGEILPVVGQLSIWRDAVLARLDQTIAVAESSSESDGTGLPQLPSEFDVCEVATHLMRMWELERNVDQAPGNSAKIVSPGTQPVSMPLESPAR